MDHCHRRFFVLRTILIGLIFFSAGAFSAPLKNKPITVKQPDGSVLNCLTSGDEYYNWLHDKDNFTIVQDPNTGWYVYATVRYNELVPTTLVAGLGNPRSLRILPGANYSSARIAAMRNARIEQRKEAVMNALRKMSGKGNGTLGIPKIPTAPTTGTINNIVIFIRFSGESEFTDATSFYSGLFNTSTPGANSLYSYYKEASYNQVSITTTFYPTPPGSTVISYQDSHPRTYFEPYNASSNPGGYQDDNAYTYREHNLLKDAVNAVSSQIPSSLNVDADNDGYVDNVCFIIDGSPGNWADLLWPHMWALYSYDVRINNKRVWNYNFQLQSWMDAGVLCHEMGHTLGLPDLYHYSYDGINPVYTWDLMEYQSNPPQHMCAYQKNRYLNWIASIPQITVAGTYTLNPLISSTGNVYKIASPYSSTEYFIVEYRRRTGTFESSLGGEGLLVYRINSVQDGQGNAGGPPDEVYIYRPNGTVTANGDPWNAAFSVQNGRTAINDATNPSSFLSTGARGGLQISNVTASGATISFDVSFCSITCPSNIVTTTATGLCGANVTYPAANITGACGTVTYNPPSGFFFPKGTTTVQVLSTAGINCMFTVTVNDNQPPRIASCAPPQTVEANASNQGVVPDFRAATVATDNCAVTSATQTPVQGSTAGTGTTSVSVNEYDAANNVATCVTSFTVVPRMQISTSGTNVTLSFGCGGDNASLTRSLRIDNTGGHYGNGTMTWTATTTAPEITLNTPSGSEGQSLVFTVTRGLLSPGTYTRTITINAYNNATNTPAVNSPYALTVTITIEPGGSVSQTQLVGTGSYTNFTNSLGQTVAAVKSNSSTIPSFTVTMTPCTIPNGLTRIRYVRRIFALNSSASAPNVAVRFYYTNSEAIPYITKPSVLTVWRQPLPAGTWVNLGGTSDTISNFVQVNSLTALSGTFALAHAWVPKSLPLTLAEAMFDAVSHRAVLQWRSALHTDESGFLIERALSTDDNAAWQAVGSVTGNGSGEYGFSDRLAQEGTYYYRISAIDEDGVGYESEPLIMQARSIPVDFSLSQNYPNPFNPSTTIVYGVPNNSHVTLRVFDALGREIATLVNSSQPAGMHSVRFNADALSAGSYTYRLEAEGVVLSKVMILVK